MTTDTLYYGGIIPGQFIATFYDFINEWYDANLDNQMARRCTVVTPVDENTEEFEISKIDFTSDDVVPKAKKSPGVEVSIAGATDNKPIWRWPDYFTLNESDLKKDPALQRRYVEACIAKIFRGEDKVWFNGRSVNNITGLQTAARANTNGKIVASGGDDATTFNNGGAWLTSDTTRDIYEDIRVGRMQLDSKYRSNLNNLYLVGNADSLDALWQKDPYSTNSEPVYKSVATLFGRSKDAKPDWAVINDQVSAGYVYIVCKNREAAEIVQSKGITIDDNYPRQPIGNLQVHLYQDAGIAFHDYNAFVELAIT